MEMDMEMDMEMEMDMDMELGLVEISGLMAQCSCDSPAFATQSLMLTHRC